MSVQTQPETINAVALRSISAARGGIPRPSILIIFGIKPWGPDRGEPIPRLIVARADALPLADGSVERIIVERTRLGGKRSPKSRGSFTWRNGHSGARTVFARRSPSPGAAAAERGAPGGGGASSTGSGCNRRGFVYPSRPPSRLGPLTAKLALLGR